MAITEAAAMQQNGNSVSGKTREHHEVQDSFEAASYASKGHKPTGLVGYGARKRWVFQHLPEALIEAFEMDTMTVSPHRLKAAYKSLLHQLHNP
jgi:hypothetical protein